MRRLVFLMAQEEIGGPGDGGGSVTSFPLSQYRKHTSFTFPVTTCISFKG